MPSIKNRSNGSYQITVSRGYDINGKKLTETVTYRPDPALTPAKREKAVKLYALEFEQKIQNGYNMDGHRTTLKEFAERWYTDYAQQNLQGRTLESYRHELDDRILPALGHLKLAEIRPMTINRFLVSLSKDGARKSGKSGGLSRGSIVRTEAVLSSVLRTATQWELLERNPCSNVRIRAEKTADQIKYFSPEEATVFLDYIEKPYMVKVKGHKRASDTGKPYQVPDYESPKELQEQMKVLFILAIFTGLRKGELLALKWSDVNFKTGEIQVSKSVTVVNGQQTVKCPKTQTSNRTVAIPEFLTKRLKKLQLEQKRYQISLGDYWQGEDWIFTQENGKMMHYGTPAHAFRDVLLRYNADKPEEEQLPLIPFHGLRHTSATLLIAAHQDVKTVQSRLGHAEASTTMNIYAHALKENDRSASDALEGMLKHA